MRPAQEFRLWARRAPTGERVATGVAMLVVVSLLAWLIASGLQGSATKVAAGSSGVGVPSGDAPGVSGAGSEPGAAQGPGGAAAAGGAAGVPGGGGASGGPAARGQSGGASSGGAPVKPGCPPVAAGTRGVSPSQIKVAITLIDIAGPAANRTFGVAAPEDQRVHYEAVMDGINRAGGIACRKVVAQYWTVNPADQNDQQSKCLDVAQVQPFLVIDGGAYSFTSPVCFPQHRIPYFGGFFLTTKQTQVYYPYLFNLANYDHLYRDTVLGFRDRGAFDTTKGFAKIGFFYRSCHPELVSQELTAFHQAGLKDSQIVTYDFGCPTAFASPSDIQAAILKFRQAGVTHATGVYIYGDLANFTNVAQQQGFKPQYLLADDGIIAISYGNLRPNPANVANALAITAGRYAEERTPGAQPTAGTAACDAILKAHGLATAYQSDPQVGNMCNVFWMIKAGAENAPALSNETLAIGLQRAKSIDFSYPNGPNDFSGARVTTGGQFWRTTQYFPDCSCWRVIDQTFHPNHP